MTKSKKIRPVGIKVAEGDIVVIGTTRSSTAANMKTTKYEEYFLSIAAKATRDGLVTEYYRQTHAHTYTLDYNQRVIAITDADKQAAAKKVFLANETRVFPDVETLKTEIISAL